MNKTELINAVVQKTGLTRKDVEKAVSAVVETMTETLKSGEKVQIVGLGGFEVKERAARIGRNPHTGEATPIAASKAVTFKAGKALKDEING